MWCFDHERLVAHVGSSLGGLWASSFGFGKDFIFSGAELRLKAGGLITLKEVLNPFQEFGGPPCFQHLASDPSDPGKRVFGVGREEFSLC